jgi:hypothetical protein
MCSASSLIQHRWDKCQSSNFHFGFLICGITEVEKVVHLAKILSLTLIIFFEDLLKGTNLKAQGGKGLLWVLCLWTGTLIFKRIISQFEFFQRPINL